MYILREREAERKDSSALSSLLVRLKQNPIVNNSVMQFNASSMMTNIQRIIEIDSHRTVG